MNNIDQVLQYVDDLMFEVLRFVLCNGRGYKRLNPYRERHLAIFVNCF
jgi:hypothetical protein